MTMWVRIKLATDNLLVTSMASGAPHFDKYTVEP